MTDRGFIPRPTGRLRFTEGRRRGLGGYANLIGAKALTSIYRRMICLVYPLQGQSIPVYRPQLDIEFRTLETEDIGLYLGFRPDVGREDVERRLARGDRCVVSWHADTIVDACWIATGSVFVPYLGRFVALEPGDVYSYDAYTDPRHRGYGIFMARNSFTARRNRAEGLQRSVALVAPENASWLILTRSGLEPIGQYTLVRTPFGGICRARAVAGHTLPALRRSAIDRGAEDSRRSGEAA